MDNNLNSLKNLKKIGVVLSEINRLKIILLLKKGELSASKINQRLSLPQNLISHHLRVLLDGEVIKNRKQGRFIYYSLNHKKIDSILGDFKKIFSL